MVQFITVFPSLFTQMLFFFNQFTVLFTSYVALLININALKRSDVLLNTVFDYTSNFSAVQRRKHETIRSSEVMDR